MAVCTIVITDTIDSTGAPAMSVGISLDPPMTEGQSFGTLTRSQRAGLIFYEMMMSSVGETEAAVAGGVQ